MTSVTDIETLKSEHSKQIRDLTVTHKEEMTHLEQKYIKEIVANEAKINELTCDIARFKSTQIGSTPTSNASGSNTPT